MLQRRPRPARPGHPLRRVLSDGAAVFARNLATVEDMNLRRYVLMSIGAACFGIGVNALILDIIAEPWVEGRTASVVIALLIATPSLVWGARLLLRGRISYLESVAFIGYCDLVILIGGVATPSGGVAIVRVLWMIGLSMYVFWFHGRLAATIQVALTMLLSVAIAARALLRGGEVFTVASMAISGVVLIVASAILMHNIKHHLDEHTTRLSEPSRLDDLTGLLNRRGLAAACAGRKGAVTVALVDLDRFKPINDTYGHAAGDEVLVRTARHLRAIIGDGALIARLGGDEFAVVADSVPADLGARLTAAASRDEIPVGASAGIVSGLVGDLNALIDGADAAMYRAKRNRHRRTA